MTRAGPKRPARPVLILAPTGRDAPLTLDVLSKAGITALICEDAQRLCREATETDVGCLLVAEEAIADGVRNDLTALVERQPSWSDLPVVILTRLGADSTTVAEALGSLGNVTLLEKPVRVAALVSVVRAALRSRERQYQIREHLRERERNAEEMRTLLDTLPVGVFVAHDTECRRITANRAGYDLLRMPVGSNLSKTAPPQQQPTHFQPCHDGAPIPSESLPVQRAARGESVHEEEVDHVFDDGAVVNTIVSASPLFDASGKSRGAIAAITDITARMKAERALREADRRKDEFLATLAHELRNPLAPIRNSLHVLRLAGVADPAVEHVREMMERQVDHMVRLVDDLMEVSRITRGKIDLRKERIELAAVIQSAIETSRPLIDGAGHSLVLSLPNEPIVLEADPLRLAQVFANLLNNAAKYEEKPGRITVSACREGETVAVSVSDSGIGIPPEMLPRVFDMFTQIDGPRRHSQGGLGIGLTLVRNLVQLHGGSVIAKSGGLGQGSEFIVRLPIVEGSLACTAPPAARSPIRVPLRVMVVDDNRDAADSLGVLLEFLGAQVRIVHDGSAALESLEEVRPDLVLLDIGMPGLDGYEVARRIRAASAHRDITLIALTGWGQEEDRRRSHDAGFDHHLIKPADIDTLQALLVSVAGEDRRRQDRARSTG